MHSIQQIFEVLKQKNMFHTEVQRHIAAIIVKNMIVTIGYNKLHVL
jgi:hypothetical protein